MRIQLIGIVLWLGAWIPLSGDAEFENDLRRFLDSYCIKCHGAEKQKGDRRFDTLQLPIEDSATLISLQEILDLLNLGEMPPEDEEKHPPVELMLEMIDRLSGAIETHHELLSSTDRQTVLRRLNRREYLNTVSDLLQINSLMYDPTQSFPRDETDHHLDTLGDHLVTSGYLLDRYVDAADEIIEKVFSMEEKPEVTTWRFTDNFRDLEGLGSTMEKIANYEYIALYEVPTSQRHEGAYGTIHDFSEGVPYDGRYKIRFQAESKNRIHSHQRPIATTNPNQLHEVAIVPGDRRVGETGIPQRIEPTLASFTLPDDIIEWYETTVWLDAGIMPRFTFPNGTINLRSAFARVFNAIAPTLEEELENNFGNRKYVTLKYGGLPHIRIHEVEITGPLYDDWPSPAVRSVLGDRPFSAANAESLLLAFADRAFRRPATEAERSQLTAFYETRVLDGVSEFQAFKDSLKRVLCSPGFLYFNEPQTESGILDDYALASRLSYFLWSSMPDQILIELAGKNQLSQPSTLRRQIRRMLKDSKAEALVENFVDLVLTLKDLGSQPPDRKAFAVFYERNLQKYMYEETRLFIEHLLLKNRPLTELINADYSFINEPLAELYNYQNVGGLGFRKVNHQNPMRSGVLGHASILTVTANGVDTSPVIRGVWMLENILGTPPSPPPPDVEPFDPDTRGALSLRDQLEKHRENPTCYDCHRKIDPLGFAFESFDPIGRQRTSYEGKLPVDSSGSLADGTQFEDVAGLRLLLLHRRDQIARALVSKLLSLGTGRRMEPGDRREIDRVVERIEERGDGFRDLIEEVVLSEVFLNK